MLLSILLAIVQSVPSVPIPEAPSAWPSLGVGGAVAGVAFWAWRQDRRDSSKRFEDLAADFRAVVQENTKAITVLGELLKHAPDRCVATELLVQIIKQGKAMNFEP
jgi:hypothetical protein